MKYNIVEKYAGKDWQLQVHKTGVYFASVKKENKNVIYIDYNRKNILSWLYSQGVNVLL